jgi:hypothetical protein
LAFNSEGQIRRCCIAALDNELSTSSSQATQGSGHDPALNPSPFDAARRYQETVHPTSQAVRKAGVNLRPLFPLRLSHELSDGTQDHEIDVESGFGDSAHRPHDLRREDGTEPLAANQIDQFGIRARLPGGIRRANRRPVDYSLGFERGV